MFQGYILKIFHVNIIYFVFLWSAASCSGVRDVKGPAMMKSPSEKYFISTTINSDKNDRIHYLCVILHLYDSENQEIDTFQTAASDRMKWASGWMKETDVLVLYSSDVGTSAWKIKDNKMVVLETLDDDMRNRGSELNRNKYEK